MLYQKPKIDVIEIRIQDIVTMSGQVDDTPLGDNNTGNDVIGDPDGNNPWAQ